MKITRAFTFTVGFALFHAASAMAQEPYQWNGRIEAGRSIEIKGINGGIRAVAANGNDVRVSATRTARRSNVEDVRFDVVPHDGGVTICAVYPSRRGQANECRPGQAGRMNVENNDVTVEWTVQVPQGVNFVGRTVNGSVQASGMPADVVAHTVNGGINVSATGVARAFTVNGDINATLGRGSWNGEVEFSTTNGSIVVTLPAGLGARVSAGTVNGDIETDFPLEVRGRFGPRRMSGTIGSGGGGLSLNTVNGGITIKRR